MRADAHIVLAAGVLLCLSCGLPSSGQLISVGSHRLEIRQQGEGLPVVVMETGIGDPLDRLIPLQERIAEGTRVVTYNRAGYGRSEPGPLPRDSGREADELRALLRGAALPPPYVLVGHSLGALNLQVFAHRYPDEVAGIVLLDPPPLSFLLGEQYTEFRAMADGMTAQWQAIADAGAAQADFFRMLASEHRELFGESARLAASIGSFGDIPLLVAAAGRPNPVFGDVAEEYQRYWIEQSRALSRKSSAGRFVLAEEASHHLYVDAPELVVDSVRSMMRALGQGPG